MDRRLALCALALLACENIPQDDFVSEGGISPDPTAILEGSVLYTGPPPRCVYRADHSVERVLGRVVLTLFAYDDPPPPEGSASSALDLALVEGLFSTRDCLPEGASAGDQRITRSVPFRWPQVRLGASQAAYQLRGFYDYDEDMNPLFSVTRLPSAGDVIGAALSDVTVPGQGLLRIALPAAKQAEDGLIYGGITVALGDVVRTERPAFALDENRTLSSAQPFVPVLGARGVDAAATLRQFRAATCAAPGAADCGLSVQRLPSNLAPTLRAAGVQLDLDDPVASAIYSAPIDVETVVVKSATSSGVDQRVPDGKIDPHPILGGALGVPWYMPALLLERMPTPGRDALEDRARIPRVSFVGTPLLRDDLTPIASSFVAAPIPMAVAPVAVVELIPGRAECRVPYFAPGTPAQVTAGRLSHCAPLPSGRYQASVLAGVAGGVQAEGSGGESPVSFSSARYAGQSWTVPNELGDPDQVRTPIPSQGLDEAFVVRASPSAASCANGTPGGLCTSGLQLVETPSGVDSVACLLRECCEYVAHLCGLPACPAETTASGPIAASPSAVTGTHANGAAIPNCVPFELPRQCCPDAR